MRRLNELANEANHLNLNLNDVRARSGDYSRSEAVRDLYAGENENGKESQYGSDFQYDISGKIKGSEHFYSAAFRNLQADLYATQPPTTSTTTMPPCTL